MREVITVVIPCKNEEGYIDRLLATLYKQTVKPAIIIADGGSADSTIQEIVAWSELLDIQLINGGNVSRGRNMGAALAKTPYVLFVDSDMELRDERTIEEIIYKIKGGRFDMVTSNIRCHNSFKGDLVYHLNNIGQRISKAIGTPFSTGAMMCVKMTRFRELGGFDEKIHFAEDYWLSKQINPKRFGIVKVNAYTSNRRFLKSGYLWMIKTFMDTYINRNNYEHFTKDINYWK